jgi:hypothetical protein
MKITKLLYSILLMTTLTACGGGGASSGASPTNSFASSSSTQTFLISTKSNSGGAVSPSSKAISINSTSDFTITPETGYKIAKVSGCDGALVGNVFTTAKVSTECTVDVTFSLEMNDVPEAPRVIAYVVEQKAKDALGDQLTQFTAAVAKDTRATTKIITVTTVTKPTDIRKLLQATENLWGAFLIGDVPTSLLNISIQEINHTRIDDGYYRLLKCSQFNQIDDFNFSIPNGGSDLWVDPNCRHGNWVSRIIGRSPGRNDDVVAFVKKDLELRHGFKWSPMFESQSLAWFGGSRKVYQQSSQAFYPDLSAFYVNHSLYKSNQISQVDVPGHTAEEMLQYFKHCITSLTEMCDVVVHGNGLGVQIEGQGEMGVNYSSDSIWLDSNTIASWPIKAKVINMLSCGPGDFSQNNFFAGNILHSGDTLLVTTPTQEIAVSSTLVARQVVTEHPSLGMGASFAEVDTLDSSPMHYFGDPTITLRTKPQGNQPMMIINGGHYHSTTSVVPLIFPDSIQNTLVKSTLRIGNAGTADLKIRLGLTQDHVGVDKVNPCLLGCTSSLAFNIAGNLSWISSKNELEAFPSYEIITIAPGAQRTIEFSFKPAFGTFADGSTKTFYGSYTGAWFMISNDPESSRVWLELSAKAVP